ITVQIAKPAKSNHPPSAVADLPSVFRSIQSANKRRSDGRFHAAQAHAVSLSRGRQKFIEILEVPILIECYRSTTDIGDCGGVILAELQSQECGRARLSVRPLRVGQPDCVDHLIAARSLDGKFFKAGGDDPLNPHKLSLEGLRIRKDVA